LNRLISIAKAQDIHVGISNEEAKFCRENSAAKIPPQQNSAANNSAVKILPQTKFFCHRKDFTPSPKFAGLN
jgi:hypothetical protein